MAKARSEDANDAVTKLRGHIENFNRKASQKPVGSVKSFDTDLMRRARVIGATWAGTAAIEIYLGLEYGNAGGTLHGGAAALVLDVFTSSAIVPLESHDIHKEGFNPPGGVTRSMNITYLRPLFLPATVLVESEVLQAGRSATIVRGSICSSDRKQKYMVCEHHKYAIGGGEKTQKTKI